MKIIQISMIYLLIVSSLASAAILEEVVEFPNIQKYAEVNVVFINETPLSIQVNYTGTLGNSNVDETFGLPKGEFNSTMLSTLSSITLVFSTPSNIILHKTFQNLDGKFEKAIKEMNLYERNPIFLSIYYNDARQEVTLRGWLKNKVFQLIK